MNNQSTLTRPHNGRVLRNKLFALSHRWLAAAFGLKLTAFIIGAVSVSLSVFPKSSPFVISFCLFVAELCIWRSERVKSLGQTLHRKLDLEDAFGWTISGAEMSDILARSPFKLECLANGSVPTPKYWTSDETPGAKRAMQNVQESAWWSKHLAESMWLICLALPIVLLIGSITLLIFSIVTFKDADRLSNAARMVTSAILLMFSVGFIRFTVGYFSFSKSAERVEQSAKVLLSADDCEMVEAIKLWQDYQLARATAPIIPTWIWRFRHGKLNALWNHYRA